MLPKYVVVSHFWPVVPQERAVQLGELPSSPYVFGVELKACLVQL